ncbi:MAG: hypothetical protein R3B54_07295 [Bdellovibrionota bacterium]
MNPLTSANTSPTSIKSRRQKQKAKSQQAAIRAARENGEPIPEFAPFTPPEDIVPPAKTDPAVVPSRLIIQKGIRQNYRPTKITAFFSVEKPSADAEEAVEDAALVRLDLSETESYLLWIAIGRNNLRFVGSRNYSEFLYTHRIIRENKSEWAYQNGQDHIEVGSAERDSPLHVLRTDIAVNHVGIFPSPKGDLSTTSCSTMSRGISSVSWASNRRRKTT